MRSVLGAGSVSLAIALAQPNAWREQPPLAWGPLMHGWQVALFCEKQAYYATEPLRVRLAARNRSGTRLKVAFIDSAWKRAEFQVRRTGEDRLLALRPERNAFDRLERYASSVRSIHVDPGGVFYPGEADLAKLFELTPGTFVISAIFRLTNPEDAGSTVPISSNELTISVGRPTGER